MVSRAPGVTGEAMAQLLPRVAFWILMDQVLICVDGGCEDGFKTPNCTPWGYNNLEASLIPKGVQLLDRVPS